MSSNQRPDTLMQDRIRQIDETSCTARPDHTLGSGAEELTVSISSLLRPPRADMKPTSRQVREGPCVDGSGLARRIFTSQAWSVQPCVRPVGAVHMTAGHNALRGSGPGQNPAFKDALARVGCPDRRIDRLCITCCSPSQPSHHAGCRHDLVTPRAQRVLCTAHPSPSSPTPSWQACWPVRWPRPWWDAAPAVR